MSFLTTLLWLVPTALGGTPLLFAEGDPVALRESTSARTGLPPDQLDPLPLRSVLTSPPGSLGDLVLRRCAGPPTDNTAVRGELARAEAALARQDGLAVQDHLDLAVALAGCLGEVAERPTLAKLFLLRGALAHERGEDALARQEAQTASALAETLTWPSTWPVAAATLWSTAKQPVPTARLEVLPGGGAAGPWINGQDARQGLSLPPGLHLGQYSVPGGLRTTWLVVGQDGTWVFPDRYPSDLLDGMLTPEGQQRVAQLLPAVLPSLSAAYVAHRGGLWLVVTEPGRPPMTSELAPGEPLPAAPGAPERTKRGK
jgi:hypothetical protein